MQTPDNSIDPFILVMNWICGILIVIFNIIMRINADEFRAWMSFGIANTLAIILIIINFPAFKKRMKEIFKKKNHGNNDNP